MIGSLVHLKKVNKNRDKKFRKNNNKNKSNNKKNNKKNLKEVMTRTTRLKIIEKATIIIENMIMIEDKTDTDTKIIIKTIINTTIISIMKGGSEERIKTMLQLKEMKNKRNTKLNQTKRHKKIVIHPSKLLQKSWVFRRSSCRKIDGFIVFIDEGKIYIFIILII